MKHPGGWLPGEQLPSSKKRLVPRTTLLRLPFHQLRAEGRRCSGTLTAARGLGHGTMGMTSELGRQA